MGPTPVAAALLCILLVALTAPSAWLWFVQTRPADWLSDANRTASSAPSAAPSGASSMSVVTAKPSAGATAAASAAGTMEYGVGTWTQGKPLDRGLWGAGAAVLDHGLILVAGGSTGPTSNNATADVKLVDSASGSWQPATAMLQARAYPMVVRLLDGSVLVMGGSRAGLPLDSVERYQPESDSWIAVSRMHHARTHGTATLLRNGMVLVAGGGATGAPGYVATATAELFDPVHGTWTDAPSMAAPRVLHSASLLPDGSVLVAGGATTYRGAGEVLASAEIYDPAANAWRSAAAMSVPRYTHSAIGLPDGRVLVAGGWSLTADTDPSLASAEVYDPRADAWSATGKMATGRAQFRMVTLPDGRAFAVGGVAPDYSTLATTELWDPRTSAWTLGGALPAPLMWPVLASTPEGRVVIVGGAKDAAVKATSNIVAYYRAPAPN